MEKPSGKPREPAIEAQHRVRLVESQLKTAAYHACVLQRLLDVSDEPLRQLRIRVQEEQHIGRQALRAAIELLATVSSWADLGVKKPSGDARRAIRRAAVGDDDRKGASGLAEAFECALEYPRFVEDRHNDTDGRLARLAGVCAETPRRLAQGQITNRRGGGGAHGAATAVWARREVIQVSAPSRAPRHRDRRASQSFFPLPPARSRSEPCRPGTP